MLTQSAAKHSEPPWRGLGAFLVRILTRPAFIYLASLLFLGLGMDCRIGIYDEAVMLTDAMRVAAGEVPHRDFYANYGPAEFYLLACLFKIFGQSVLVERAFDLLVRGAIVTACYRLCLPQAGIYVALAIAAVTALWLFSVPYYAYPLFPVTVLLLVAAGLILRTLTGTSVSWRLFGAGAAVGLSALFRYDVGFLVFAALGSLVGISAVIREDHQCVRAATGRLLPYVLGTSVVFVPVAFAYLTVAPIAPFVHDVVSFPLHYYARMRNLPFPGAAVIRNAPGEAAVYLPVLICGCAICALFMSKTVSRTDRGRYVPSAENGLTWFLRLFALLAGVLYFKGLVRVSPVHMMASLIPSFVLLAGLLGVSSASQGRLIRLFVVAILACTVTITGYAAKQSFSTRRANGALALQQIVLALKFTSAPGKTWCGTPAELRAINCFIMDQERADAALYLARNTDPDERIFVGLLRHDVTFANDNLIYFASGRLPATRWHHFDPGLQTSAQVQAEIIAELAESRVRYVILTSDWQNVTEPNDSRKSSGVYLLDAFIRSHYRQIADYDGITIWFIDDRFG